MLSEEDNAQSKTTVSFLLQPDLGINTAECGTILSLIMHLIVLPDSWYFPMIMLLNFKVMQKFFDSNASGRMKTSGKLNVFLLYKSRTS